MEEFSAGGDPVCWLSRVCPECGSFAEQEQAKTCPRCGARLPDAEDTPDIPPKADDQ